MTATPPPADDDAMAEALADAWIERAATDPALRRLALRAAGLRKAPADMSRTELARELRVSERTLRRLEATALAKLAHSPLLQAYTRSATSPES